MIILQVETRDDSDDENTQCKEAWSSRLHSPKIIEQNAAEPMSIQTFKRTANNFLHKGNFEQAIQYYTATIDACTQEGLEDSQLAVLHSNRALAHTRNGSYAQASYTPAFIDADAFNPRDPPSHTIFAFTGKQAVEDAQKARKLNPAWPKPMHRLAQALAGSGQWEKALAACREGTAGSAGVSSEFEPLIDEIAVSAALHGSLAGFSGRRLEARLHTAWAH